MENLSKQYLYHIVPDAMRLSEEGHPILYPLNIIKEKFPDLYEVEIKKYRDSENAKRQNIPLQIVPTLEQAAWGDVIQLSAIHPEDIKKALLEAGFSPRELKFYQVDPNLLDPQKTTIFLYRKDMEDIDPKNFAKFDPENLHEHAEVPERTREYYREVSDTNKITGKNNRPFLFVGVPHIFHKGPIDVSNFPVIVV